MGGMGNNGRSKLDDFTSSMPLDLLQTFGHDIVLRLRQATCWTRPLPSFLIIGAQRAGTTSLFSYLSQHPQLLPSRKKEVHFFDGGSDPNVDTFKKGLCWYRSFFPLTWKSHVTSKAFEASPLYLLNPLAPQRIAELLPDVKLIAVLRNPTERAISHYFHETRNGRESLPIMEALLSEEERLRPALCSKDYKSEVFRRYSYKLRGHYCEQLRRYADLFPSDRMLVLQSESLFSRPSGVLRRIYEFVGVDKGFVAQNLIPRNMGTNREKVEPEVYSYLQDHFRSRNYGLYRYLKQGYSW
jgi:hypothetical protein